MFNIFSETFCDFIPPSFIFQASPGLSQEGEDTSPSFVFLISLPPLSSLLPSHRLSVVLPSLSLLPLFLLLSSLSLSPSSSLFPFFSLSLSFIPLSLSLSYNIQRKVRTPSTSSWRWSPFPGSRRREAVRDTW